MIPSVSAPPASTYAVYLTIKEYLVEDGGRKMIVLLFFIGASLSVLGALYAVIQKTLKKSLVGVFISQISLSIIGIGIRTQSGMTGALFNIIALIVVMGIFAISGFALKSSIGIVSFKRLRTICTTLIFLLGAWSLGSIPPSAGFISRWYISLGILELEAFQPGLMFIWLLMAGFPLIWLICVLRPIILSFGKFKDMYKGVLYIPLGFQIVLIILGLACILMALYHKPIISMMECLV